MTFKYLTYFMLSWYTLAVCQASMSVNQVIDQYINFIKKSGNTISFKQVEHNLNETFSDILTFKGTEAFKAARKELKTRLQNQRDINYRYWIKTIDKTILIKYLINSTAKFSKLPPNHIARFYLQKLKEMIEKDEFPIFFQHDVKYKNGTDGRGRYYRDTQEISLDIHGPDEIILTFVHEMTHRLDPELEDAEYNLFELLTQVKEFFNSDPSTWSDGQKLIFGRYHFLKHNYLPSFKEYLPRVNACQTFVDLYQLDLLKNPAAIDLDRYRPILSNKLDCHELTAKEMRDEYQTPYFYFRVNKVKHHIVVDYYKVWLKENNIPFPIY